MVKRRSTLLAAAALLALGAPAPASAARKKPPELTRIRCVPATSATCRSAIKVTIGRQLQLSGRRVYKGMRVSFRWSRGALATKLDRTRVGYVARVPAGTRAGSVSVTVSDRAGRRSNARKITVEAPPRIGGPAPAPGTLPEVFKGNGMWIWELSQRRRRRRRRDRRPRPRRRGLDRLRQELRRRLEPLGPVQPGARRGAEGQRPARLRVAVRLRQRPAGRGQPRRRRDRRRRRLPGDRRRIRVQGQVRRRAAVHRRAAGDRRPGVPDRLHLVPVRGLPRDAAVLGLPQPRRAPRPTCRRSTGRTSAAPSTPSPAARWPRTASTAPRSPRSGRPTAPRRRRTSRASARCGRATAAPACPGGRGSTPPSPAGPRSRSPSPRCRFPPADPGWPRSPAGAAATRSCGCSSTWRASTRR